MTVGVCRYHYNGLVFGYCLGWSPDCCRLTRGKCQGGDPVDRLARYLWHLGKQANNADDMVFWTRVAVNYLALDVTDRAPW